MRKEVYITLMILLLTFIASASVLCQELDRDSISITINITERIEVEFGDQGVSTTSTLSSEDSQTLDLNLAEGTGSSTRLRITSNTPLSVSFESINGFSEEINDFFEYVVVYYEEGEEKQVSFSPGGNLPRGILEMEPGKEEWKLIIRLKEDIAEQWEIVLDEETEIDTEALGTEWTQLEPGVYTDVVNLTFHHLAN